MGRNRAVVHGGPYTSPIRGHLGSRVWSNPFFRSRPPTAAKRWRLYSCMGNMWPPNGVNYCLIDQRGDSRITKTRKDIHARTHAIRANGLGFGTLRSSFAGLPGGVDNYKFSASASATTTSTRNRRFRESKRPPPTAKRDGSEAPHLFQGVSPDPQNRRFPPRPGPDLKIRSGGQNLSTKNKQMDRPTECERKVQKTNIIRANRPNSSGL